MGFETEVAAVFFQYSSFLATPQGGGRGCAEPPLILSGFAVWIDFGQGSRYS